MFNNRLAMIVICLAGTLAALVLSPAPLAAQEVVLILGSGFSPGSLEPGSRPQEGTLIEADTNTIVVLKKSWALKGFAFCEDWVILRGDKYPVDTATPKKCSERGNGDEVARAMKGESMVGHLTVLVYNDPKADSAEPQELRKLKSDLWKLSEKVEDTPKPPKPPPKPPKPVSSKGQIQARYRSSVCLHRKYNNWDNGNPIHLWSCAAGSDSMKTWRYESKTGYVRSAANPGKCWHKKVGNWANGNPIHLWDCKAGPAANKSWTYDAQSGLIRARGNPAKCIHKKSGGFGNGNPVHLWDCNAGVPEFKSWRLH